MAAGDPSVLRWAVSLHDELCHALKPTDIDRAVARGYAEALCGHRIPGAALDPLNQPEEMVCIDCVIAATVDLSDPGQFGTAL